MKVKVFEEARESGKAAAEQAAKVLNEVIAEKGSARLLLSTGASQFKFFEAFVKEDVDWSKVEMFHLDEYVGISKEHPASFNRYLRERFVEKVHPGKFHLMDGEKDPTETIKEITALLNEKPVDLGIIGIGENAHIAFNDPPADFEDKRAYKVVDLDDRCLMQQIGEGWFKSKDECYKQAISMTCSKIMACKTIISVVPYAVKAEAVFNALTGDLSPLVPATVLKEHGDITMYLDKDSAKLLNSEILAKFR